MSNVIQLKPRSNDDLQPSLPIKKQSGHCSHKSVQIDIDEKELRCTNCNAVIYPFDYVLSLAYEERKLFWDMDEVRQQIKKLTEQKKLLEKEVSNLKAAKRRYKE